jgi:hypothetical protein
VIALQEQPWGHEKLVYSVALSPNEEEWRTDLRRSLWVECPPHQVGILTSFSLSAGLLVAVLAMPGILVVYFVLHV